MTVVDYPYTIGWGITNRCNLNCKHCNMDSGSIAEKELSFLEACTVIDEFSKRNIRNICFTGGEPFARSDFLDLCEYAISKGIFVCVTTNGTLIQDCMIDKHLYKFQLVRVSIDAPRAEVHDDFRNQNGVFEKAISAIQRMLEGGCNVGVVTCVSRRNIGDLDAIAEMIASLGVKKWFLPLLSPSGRGKNLEDDVLSPREVQQFILTINGFQEKYGLEIGVDLPYAVMLPELSHDKAKVKYGHCPAGITQIMIFPNGDISPCFAMRMKCGNVRTDQIADIWLNHKVFRAFRDKKLVHGKCSQCEHLDACGAGCRAVPYIINGDYLGEDSVCWKG